MPLLFPPAPKSTWSVEIDKVGTYVRKYRTPAPSLSYPKNRPITTLDRYHTPSTDFHSLTVVPAGKAARTSATTTSGCEPARFDH